MKQIWWLITRSLYLDIMLFSVPGIGLRAKFGFICRKYFCIVRDRVQKMGGAPRTGGAFDGTYYYNDEFATGLLQSLYVHNHTLRKYVAPGAVIIDIGANVGQFCTFSQHYLRAGKVISFEPLPEPFAALQFNNKFISLPYAIGARDGSAELFIDDRDIFATLVAPIDTDSGLPEKRTIEVRRLDDIVEIVELEHIDLLKIDTEGSELDIITSSPLTIQKASYVMIECSINRTSAGDIAQVMGYLAQAHPELHVIDVMNPFARGGRLECIDVLWENRSPSVRG